MTDDRPPVPDGFVRGYYAEITDDAAAFSERAAKLREPYSETRNVLIETQPSGALIAWFDVPAAEYAAVWRQAIGR